MVLHQLVAAVAVALPFAGVLVSHRAFFFLGFLPQGILSLLLALAFTASPKQPPSIAFPRANSFLVHSLVASPAALGCALLSACCCMMLGAEPARSRLFLSRVLPAWANAVAALGVLAFYAAAQGAAASELQASAPDAASPRDAGERLTPQQSAGATSSQSSQSSSQSTSQAPPPQGSRRAAVDLLFAHKTDECIRAAGTALPDGQHWALLIVVSAANAFFTATRNGLPAMDDLAAVTGALATMMSVLAVFSLLEPPMLSFNWAANAVRSFDDVEVRRIGWLEARQRMLKEVKFVMHSTAVSLTSVVVLQAGLGCCLGASMVAGALPAAIRASIAVWTSACTAVLLFAFMGVNRHLVSLQTQHAGMAEELSAEAFGKVQDDDSGRGVRPYFKFGQLQVETSRSRIACVAAASVALAVTSVFHATQ